MRKKKKFRRKEDPIKKILKINNKAYMRQKKMNEIILKILERYELDKPILMSDKFDCIWEKQDHTQ